MPAAAVIPAPVAYIKVVAVKKLVVGFQMSHSSPPLLAGGECSYVLFFLPSCMVYHSFGWALSVWIVYFEKIRVFKAGLRCEYISME